jgi:iron complex outermembrane receptor protein
VNDIRFSYQLRFKQVKEVNLNFQLNNVLNRMYETNGYTFGYIYGGQTITENYYYPMAGINFMAGINIKI